MLTFKNLFQKSIIATLVMSMVLVGVSLSPISAFAKENNGLHLGFGISAKGDSDGDKDDQNVSMGVGLLGQGNDSIKDIVKPAQTTFKQAVKDANITFKTAKKTAQTQLKASVSATTNQADRIAALKAYFSSVLAAFKVKTAAIEAAFQAFINTNFNVNHAPVANAQSVTVHENTATNITLTVSDAENSPLTYAVVTTTIHGTLSGTAPNLVYTPNANFTGTDNFTFKVNDGSLDSTLATVSMTVNP